MQRGMIYFYCWKQVCAHSQIELEALGRRVLLGKACVYNSSQVDSQNANVSVSLLVFVP